ncbi:rhomboid family intramembrane serine protease [Mucilaginibacter limnophilus]|uniref:Rhomboid family intramembrane serine protease n=1 Tax=Mucilaginibacter limnophilus TaxID=1932778 RepID=A0A3S2V8J0_9SPHI|nr:rhomboid family intramembrane serine protease [Mucilaginibacter limnophilus]RVU01254.1 rhomboid family intramembrane serine protease [Mucilaginibacter limnophilus]
MTLWQNITYKMLHTRSKLFLLIGINVAVFLLINVPATFELWFLKTGYITSFSTEYLALPASFEKLATRFWTPITYMFMHADVFHILFNMLWLYWMGQIFEEYLGTKRTLGLYILGGLSGALFFLLAMNFIPGLTNPDAIIVGASAGVMAIIIATATLLPNYTIHLFLFGPVKLKWLAIFYVLIDFLSTAGSNAGGSIAHLGGALLGFIYIKRLQSGSDWIGSINKMFTPQPKMKVVVKNPEKNTSAKPKQEEIDRILDKISLSGYDNLTRQEKEILFRASKDEG